MQYYIPEWDDLVSSRYDYWNDTELPDSRKVYAHEIYPKPNYDGILVSRMKIEESKTKIEKIKKVGVHKFFRFNGPIFGDCGAWGYINEKNPPFETKDMLNYYESFGFNIGVSIDHLCIPQVKSEWYYRQELTLKNAENFFELYESGDYSFEAVGAAQGWDLESYRYAVQELLDIGYDFIALGGLARAQTGIIIKILKNIQDLIKGKKIKIHLFGAARLDGLRAFNNLGVTSFDSASPLRNAWLGSKKNYRGLDWKGYTAIRLPFLSRTKKYQNLVEKGLFTIKELEEFEKSIYALLRRYEIEKSRSPEEIIEAFEMLNQTFTLRDDLKEDYLEILNERPWEKCSCPVCKEAGMDVVIFRGNNRNRRRGFHNTYVFYQLMQKILNDANFKGTPHLNLIDEKDFSIPIQVQAKKLKSKFNKQTKIDNFIEQIREE